MQKLTIEAAKNYAEEGFSKMGEKSNYWNVIHAKCMIKALRELVEEGSDIDINRLEALAWIHDIGKVKSDDGHAFLSLEILENEFELNDIDRDCIVNHGSSGKPFSEEAKMFQTVDGISLFYPEAILFRFYVEAKEGKSFDEILAGIKDQYFKYHEVYSDRPRALDLLKAKYDDIINF